MRPRTILGRGGALAAALLVAAAIAVPAAAGGAKKFAWTTKSKEAGEMASRIMTQIESMATTPGTAAEAKKIVELDPDFAFGHYLVATFNQGVDAELAKTEAEKALALAEKASEGEREYIGAVLQFRAGERDKALPRLQALAVKYPDERLVQMMLGQVYVAAAKPAEARAAYQRAIAIDPSLPRVYAFLGNLELLADNYAKAREAYTKAASMAPKGAIPFNAVFGTVFTHIYEGQFDVAAQKIEAMREDYRKNNGAAQFPEVFIWNALARVHLENGKPELALEEYKKGYESVPASSLPDDQKKAWLGRMHHGMGRALAKLGKHDEAWKQAETIKAMIEAGGEQGKQYWPAYHYMAGYLKLEAGDYKAAVEHLGQADKTDAFHLLLLARAYEKAGDGENAAKTYKTIVDSQQVSMERALAYPEAKRKLKR
jgi:tetratricopeptide (TPR) repeat protein